MHMGRIRQYVVMSLLACAPPFAAHAQWATTVTEHDWRLTIAARPYGLLQRVHYVGARIGGTRTTTLCLGPYTANTRVPAACVATVILLPVGVVGLLVLRGLFPGKKQS